MKTFHTELLKPNEPKLETERLWVYNGLDCCVTLEVLEQLLPQLDNLTAATYSLSRDLQAPVLEMNMRGVLIDEQARTTAIANYKSDSERLERNLYRIVHDGVGYTGFVNSGKTKAWRSNGMVATLLYDVMRLPEVRKRNERGELARTVNREALEKLQIHFLARPIIAHILALKTLAKRSVSLKQKLTPTVDSGRAITLPALRQADFLLRSTILDLEEISKILKSVSDESLSQTQE